MQKLLKLTVLFIGAFTSIIAVILLCVYLLESTNKNLSDAQITQLQKENVKAFEPVFLSKPKLELIVCYEDLSFPFPVFTQRPQHSPVVLKPREILCLNKNENCSFLDVSNGVNF